MATTATWIQSRFRRVEDKEREREESITIVRPAGRREEEKQGRVRSAGLLSRALGGAWTGGIGRAGSTGDGGESWDGGWRVLTQD